ncbi:MAG TPA: hypothetical protein VKK31_02230 [Thermoanaerobaculia bacterium]|nr:hypothetical protein [Thermoanaerobaculia bacterium]
MKAIITSPRSLSVLCFFAIFLVLVLIYEQTIPQRTAHEIWRRHEQVVSDAAAGKHIDLNDFSDAALFFVKLTGINVPGEHSTYIDWMPNQDTATALEPLRRWYAQNKDRLYWDEMRKEVKLKARGRE